MKRPPKELKEYWIDELEKSCSRFLSAASQYKFEVKVAKLYESLEESLIRAQSDGNSIRRILKNKEDATSLVESLHDSSEYRDAQMDQKFQEIGSILAVALAGVISARLDDNYKAIGWIYEWCSNRLSDGHDPEDFTFLTAAKYYHDLGRYRCASISSNTPRSEWPALPSGKDLDRLLKKVEQESEEADEETAKDYAKRLHLFVVEAIAQLPPYLTEEVKNYTNFLNALKQTEMAEHHRFSYILSRAAYAQDRLDEAIALAIKALQATPAIDVSFIAQCRQYLLTLEQEKVARTTIVANSKDELRPELDALRQQTREVMRQDMQKMKNDMRQDMEKQTKESMLRVIEILGIFLAVAGVVVTQVSGISVGGSAWETIGIFTAGYLTIVSLFFILRLMVLKPLIVVRRDLHNNKEQTETQATGGISSK